MQCCFRNTGIDIIVGDVGGSSKNANRIFSQELTVQIIHIFNRFFTVLQNLMAFVEKLQPVEKVDLSDVEIGTLSSDKILEVTSLRKRVTTEAHLWWV